MLSLARDDFHISQPLKIREGEESRDYLVTYLDMTRVILVFVGWIDRTPSDRNIAANASAFCIYGQGANVKCDYRGSTTSAHYWIFVSRVCGFRIHNNGFID